MIGEESELFGYRFHVDVRWNAVPQDLMDHGVDHIIFETVRQQDLAGDPRVYTAILFLVRFSSVKLGALVVFA